MSSFTKTFGAVALLSLLATCQTACATTNTCYFPNGDVASDYVTCSSTGDGGCCASGDFCTEWGYCISNSKGYHYRGACTDSTWGNPSCPDYCLANTNSGNSSLVNIIACNAAATSGSWCCAYDGNCCNDTSATFTPSFGTIFAEGGATTSTTSGSTIVSRSAATTTSSSQSSTTTGSLPTLTASYAAQTSSPSNTRTTSKSSNKSTIIGAAVGVPLGVIAIAGLVLFLMERRKRKTAEAQKSFLETDDKTRYEYYKGEAGGTHVRVNSEPSEQSTMVASDVSSVPRVEAEGTPTNSGWGSGAQRETYELSSAQNHELPTDTRF